MWGKDGDENGGKPSLVSIFPPRSISRCTAATFKMKLQQFHWALPEKAIKKYFWVKSAGVKMLILSNLEFKSLIHPSFFFLIFQCVFLRYSCWFSLGICICTFTHHLSKSSIGCNTIRAPGTLIQTYCENIFARIWINFWRCEWSMITHFCLSPSCVTAGQLSWGQASILMFVCVSVLMWAPAKHHSLHVQRCKNCTAQIQTFTSHTDRMSLKLVYQKRNSTHSACVFCTSGKISSFL